jgi:hypothetical protein
MLYGHLEIHANRSRNFLGVLMVVWPPRKLCHTFHKLHTTKCLDFCAIKRLYGLCKFILYELRTIVVPSLKFVPKLNRINRVNPYCMTSNKCFSLFSISVLPQDCKGLGIRAVQPPVNDELLALKSVLVYFLGMHALALRNCYSLAARKLSLSCSLKMKTTTQQWVRPPILIDLMR